MINPPQSFSILGLLTLAIFPLSIPLSTNINSQEISLKFPPPQDRGAPTTTSGGGMRSGSAACINIKEGDLSLNALTPNYSNIATTASATPNLYYYIPPTSATSGELIVTDENDNEVYETTFNLPNQPGIIKLVVKTRIPLVSGKKYYWSLMMICDRQNRYRNISLEGRLDYQQLEPAAIQSIETKDVLEKAKFFASKGFWLDTLDNAAKAQANHPQEWIELLNSVGLEALSNQPILKCCTMNSN
jgi:Domain of Unknown Function (DUF928)